MTLTRIGAGLAILGMAWLALAIAVVYVRFRFLGFRPREGFPRSRRVRKERWWKA